jgi:uncharacterized membrane protein YphA (DoxX/SURF4 family)
VPKSIREISFLACLLIVGLRVAIGWQFLYEGIWKLNSQKGSRPWTAEPYLANARGPFRDTFRDMVPDVDGLERLDYDKMVENWDGWYARFQAHHPDLDDVQKQKIELLLNGPKEFVEPLAALPAGVDLSQFKAPKGASLKYDAKSKRLVADFHLLPAEKQQLLGLLPESASEEERSAWTRALDRLYDRTSKLSLKERLQVLVKEDPDRVGLVQESHYGTIDHKRIGDIDLYRNMLARYEANLKSAALDFEHRHLDKLWADMQEKKVSLVAPVDALTQELVSTAEKSLTAKQLTRGAMRKPPSQLAQANFITMYGLLILGALLMVGLFSRLSALGAAGLLVLFYLAMPPWPGVPEPPGPEHALIINKNLIEAIACLMLATIPTGRWVGLDALVRRYVLRQPTD